MTQSTQPGITLKSVNMRFGGLQAISELTMEIVPGRITALIGPNGAGKTTIFNLITGFLKPNSGTIRYADHDLLSLRPDQVARTGIGRSFQDLKLFRELTCLDNVLAATPVGAGESVSSAIVMRRRIKREETERIEKAEEMLAFTGLQDKRNVRARDLGYAEAKMLMLARVLMLDSRILLLDEPCSGLDHAALDRVRDMLTKLVDQGHTICLIEHNMALVRDVADFGIFLEQGALIAEDTIDNLLADSGMRERYLGIGA